MAKKKVKAKTSVKKKKKPAASAAKKTIKKATPKRAKKVVAKARVQRPVAVKKAAPKKKRPAAKALKSKAAGARGVAGVAGAIEVIKRFIAAAEKQDQKAMKACLTKASAKSGNFNGTSPAGASYHIGEPRVEGDVVIIPVRATAPGQGAMELPCRVVRENGAWKFDLAGTMDQLMQPMLDQMVSAVGEAFEGMGKALSEGMKAAFGDDKDAEQDEEDEEEEDEPAFNVEAIEPEESDEEVARSTSNDGLFASAVESFRSAEDAWKMQLDMALGHSSSMFIDYDSVNGQYDLLQPFIHQAVSGALGAVSMVAFDPQWQGMIREIHRVWIRRAEEGTPTSATVDGDELVVRVNIDQVGPPPVAEVADAIKAALSATPAEQEELAALAGGESTDGFDRYKRAETIIEQLYATMKDVGMWPGDKPPGEIEVRGAFGSENMSFAQWLAWVLIPRVESIVQERGEFPGESNLAAYAVRELDGVPGNEEVTGVLAQLDALVNGHPATLEDQ